MTYYHGASEDYIETVKYQVLDELQAKMTKAQADNKDLQGKLDAANKRIKELQSNLGKTTDNQVQQLQSQVVENERTIQQLAQEKELLQHRLDSVSKKAIADNEEFQKTLTAKEQSISQLNDLQNQQPKAVHSPVVGVEVNLGQVVPVGCINEQWTRTNETSMQIDAYFGTPRLMASFPLSVEGGVGFHKFSMSAYRNAHSFTLPATDCDGYGYNALYRYSDLNERLSLSYINVPIRLCIGQPIKNQVSVYAKIGVTPSFNLGSDFEGSGTYTIKGHYPQWGIVLADIEELGLLTDQEYGGEESQPTINKFVLWGNIALGAHVPFGKTPLQLNAGIKLDYSLMEIGMAQKSSIMPEGRGLLPEGGKVLLPGINVGLVYLLK